MLFNKFIDKKFTQWGKGKQQVPGNMVAMKEKFLAAANIPASKPLKIKPRKLYIGLLSTSFAVLLLVVGLKEYAKNSLMVASSPTASYSPGSPGYGGELEKLGGQQAYDASVADGDMGIQYSEVTALGRQDGIGGVVDSVANRAKSIVGDFVQPEYQQFGSTAAVDDREFLKYSYNSNIQTREVEEVATKILTIVRGYNGRVDNARINDQYANVSFVVPKDELLNFKMEIKALVNKRFYQESLYLQNLLPEKVYLEDSAQSASKLLSDAQDKLKDLNEKHTKTIAGLQRNLNGVNASIAKLKTEVTTDPARQKQIKTEIASLSARRAAIQRQISDENTWYGWDKTRLEQDVKNNQSQLDALAKQDKQLDEHVETVQGNISIQWVSIPEMLEAHVPYYWAWVIGLCLLALIVNFFGKRRTIIVS